MENRELTVPLAFTSRIIAFPVDVIVKVFSLSQDFQTSQLVMLSSLWIWRWNWEILPGNGAKISGDGYTSSLAWESCLPLRITSWQYRFVVAEKTNQNTN
jgi:hypothetical protein